MTTLQDYLLTLSPERLKRVNEEAAKLLLQIESDKIVAIKDK
jgi:hypothetical protein